MAHGAAHKRAVSVRLRRVVAGRSVRRLLVLAGLVVAGWLLGCLTQSAHADETPAVPDSGLVTRLDQITRDVPVLGIAPRPEALPKPEVVRTPLRVAPRLPAAEAPQAVRTVEADAPAVRRAPAERPVRTRDRHIEVDDGTEAEQRRSATAHAPEPVLEPVRHHRHDTPAPLPAPAPDGSSSAVTPAPFGGPVGLPDDRSWALQRPQVSYVRVLGAAAPAVRTAADEPSFAPD